MRRDLMLHHRLQAHGLFLTAYIPGALFLWLLWTSSIAYAQGSPITSSGLNTQVSDPIVTGSGSTQVTQYDITGGTRAGTNLLHSFRDFNVPDNHVANFLNDTVGLKTENILGRVTGGNVSNILGMLQTTGFGDANLFLMNPSGIVFGPSASLNVGGSVVFTTADYLRLAGNERFAAIPNATTDALLSTAPVVAYGFLSANPKAITVQDSHLSVQESQSISLIGGNITVDAGKLTTDHAHSGSLPSSANRINLASVASSGEVLAKTLDYGPNINGQLVGQLGTIKVLERSVIDVGGKGGGTVFIRGGQFVLDNSTISANIIGSGPAIKGVESIGGGIDIILGQDATIQNLATLETNVTGNATPGVTYGGVHIKAEHIEILGNPDVSPNTEAFTHIRSNVASGSLGGNSGPITLEANSILVKNFATTEFPIIGTNTKGNGNGGNIILQTNGSIRLDHALLETDSFGLGKAGDIEITSAHENILVTNGSQVTSQNFDSGTIGHITVTAPAGEIRLSNLDSEPQSIFTHDQGVGRVAGHGGIQITAKDLTIVNSKIQIDNFTPAQPGDLTVNLTGRLSLSGNNMSSPAIQTTTRGPAQSANLNISAHEIFLTGDSVVSTESRSSGAGGQLDIFADTLQLTSGAQIRSGSGKGVDPNTGTPLVTSGSGGTVTIQGQAGPADSILIDGHGTVVRNRQPIVVSSGITSNAEGTGQAGDIVVNAKTVTLQNGGAISASTNGFAPSATGGSITVTATDQVTLTKGGSITASSIVKPETPKSGIANAGNISINAGQQLEVLDGSSITTRASKASGGNIDIRAIDRIRFVNSIISTSVLGEDGSGGNIFIDPKVVVLQGSTVTAQAVGGTGGNITFVTPLFLADSASVISASSQRGVSGTVTIQSPTSNLSGTVGQLASKVSPPQMLLQNRCIALASGEQSTFILAGRDALPSEPGGWLSSPIAMEHWTGEAPDEHVSRLMVRSRGWNTQPLLVVSKDKSTVLSLRRLTPPGFLVRSFATGTTGCPS